jgi:CRISPR-associated protein Cas1
LPIAFGAAKQALREADQSLDRLVRKRAAEVFSRQQVIPLLIDRIKDVLRTTEEEVSSED